LIGKGGKNDAAISCSGSAKYCIIWRNKNKKFHEMRNKLFSEIVFREISSTNLFLAITGISEKFRNFFSKKLPFLKLQIL
jgi:aspartyl/asparaginyl beta-hydroxylase (cupin superfamily)